MLKYRHFKTVKVSCMLCPINIHQRERELADAVQRGDGLARTFLPWRKIKRHTLDMV